MTGCWGQGPGKSSCRAGTWAFAGRRVSVGVFLPGWGGVPMPSVRSGEHARAMAASRVPAPAGTPVSRSGHLVASYRHEKGPADRRGRLPGHQRRRPHRTTRSPSRPECEARSSSMTEMGSGMNPGHQVTESPPSTTIVAPVMYADAGEARKSTVAASSSGSPARAMGSFDISCSA